MLSPKYTLVRIHGEPKEDAGGPLLESFDPISFADRRVLMLKGCTFDTIKSTYGIFTQEEPSFDLESASEAEFEAEADDIANKWTRVVRMFEAARRHSRQ